MRQATRDTIRRLLPGSIPGMLFLLLIIVAVPTLLVEGAIHYSQFQTERAKQFESDMELARVGAAAFNNFIQDVAHRESDIGAALGSSQRFTQAEAEHIISSIANETSSIYQMNWLDPNGNLVASGGPSVTGIDASVIPYVQSVIGGQDFAVTNLFLKEGGQPAFAVLQARRDGTGTLEGIMVAEVDPRRLGGIFQMERAGQGAFVIIDRQGWLVYRYPESDLPWEDRNLGATRPVVGRALQGQEITDSVKDVNGQERMASYTPIRSIGWVASASRTESEVLSPLVSEFASDSALHLLVVVMAFLAALVMGRRITDPARRLREHALALGRGELDRRIEDIDGPSELSQLADVFNFMASEIQAREKQGKRVEEVLRKARDELETRVLERTAELRQTVEVLEHEIRGRQRIEEALRESEEKYRQLVDLSPDGIAVLSEGKIAFVNAALARFLGASSAGEMIGKPMLDVIHQDSLETVKGRIGQLTGNGEKGLPFVRLKYLRVDGTTAVAETSAVPVTFNGKPAIQSVARDLSDRMTVEEERDRLVSILEATTDFVATFSPDGALLYLNGAGRRVIGIGPEADISHRHITDLVPESTRAKLRNEVFDAINREGSWAGELTALTVDGREVPVLVVCQAHRAPEGSIQYISSIARGITELKRTEEALRRSEQTFRSFVENSQDGIVLTDELGIVVEWNPGQQRITGLRREAAVGMPIWDVLFRLAVKERQTPDNYKRIKASMLDLLTEPEWPHIGEFQERQFQHPDGTRRIMQTLVSPIKTDKGFIIGSISRDITEHERAEEALRESEERYRRIVETAVEGVWVLDTGHKTTFANSRMAEMLGCTVEELLGKPVFTFLSEDQHSRVLFNLQRRQWGVKEQFDLKFRRKDGTDLWTIVSASPIFDMEGRFIGSLGMVTDISERKRAEEQLLRAQRLEMAGRIAGQVAHDFNNLLTPLTAYPELIKMELPEEHPASNLCDSMLNAAQQMAEINEDLLTLSRRGHFKDEVVDMNRAVIRSVEEISPKPAGLSVECHLAPDLLPISGSEAQLCRVISNLLSNAREAMTDTGRLTVKTENVYIDNPIGRYNRIDVGEYVRLEVSDTGCGIPREVMDKVFDPFFTTKSTDRRRGSGLGLSIVQTIVEDHEGYVDVESVVGLGTTFSIYLPVSRDTSVAEQEIDIRGGREAILVVDDDGVQREVVGRLLGSLGYKVDAVASGEEAVTFLREQSADLLVLDMVMSGEMDGADTYRRVLGVRPGQRAIILSGFAESERVTYAQRLGAGTYIRKPVTLSRLAHAVREELDRCSPC